MTDQTLNAMGAYELSGLIRAREVSPVEVAEACLARIEAHNGDIKAFVTVAADRAMDDARRAEAEIAGGKWRGPLHGIPYGAKDIIDTAGIRTTNGSRLYETNVPAADAPCIARLGAAGAVFLGKTNTHQWAAASTTINTHYGTTRNPWNREHIVGGSSGGSAAAVAAAMCPITLGSDTGGSIRTPAALCGIVGFKPTHGRVPLTGVYPNTPTFDHIGPMTQTVRDAALALQAIAGHEPADAKSQNHGVDDFMAAIEAGVKDMRIVLCPDYHLNSEVDAEIAEAFERVVDAYRDLGARVETVSFPDAQRFGELFRRVSGPEFAEVHRPVWDKDPTAFEDDVAERLAWSFKVTTDDYVRGMRDLTLMRREVDRFYAGFDAMISPTVPCLAPPIDTLVGQINGRDFDYRTHIHRPFLTWHNVSGCPAVALPMGLSRTGLPMSFQVSAGRWREAGVLRVARAHEAVAPAPRTSLAQG